MSGEALGNVEFPSFFAISPQRGHPWLQGNGFVKLASCPVQYRTPCYTHTRTQVRCRH